jgi:hypothetical protein
MTMPIPRRYYLIPVVYIALISGLIAMELTGTVKIEERLNNLIVTALVPARRGGDSQAIRRLDLDIDGLALSFSRQEPLEFRLSSGRSVYSHLTGYTSLPSGVEIDFGERLKLVIHPGGGDQTRFEIRTDLDESAELIVPFSSSGGSSVDEFKGLPLLTVSQADRRGKTVTAVALPADSTIDLSNGEREGAFIFRNSSGVYRDMYVTRLEEPESSAIAHWFHVQYSFPDRAVHDSILESYLEAAYLGWTYTRYSITSGTWRMPDSTQSFDERILTSALTEGLRVDTYSETVDRFRGSIQLHQEEISWTSAPHLGDIVNKGKNIAQGDLEKIKNIETMVSEEDLAVFSLPGLLAFIVNSAPTPLFQDLAGLAARTDPATAETKHAPGLLNVYLESREIDDPLSAAFDGFHQAAETCILPAVWLTDQGYFVTGSDGTIDVLSSIRAGIALARFGVFLQDNLYEAIGLELLSSALSLSESEGFLPATLRIDERTVIGSLNVLLPEELYPLITDRTYYPHHVSLSGALGSQGWVWTSAQNFQASQGGSSIRLSFDYPVNETHHFVVSGIEPFSSITLFGIKWKSDPRFQFYRSGWLYDEAEKNLYAKITHSEQREELLISYE